MMNRTLTSALMIVAASSLVGCDEIKNLTDTKKFPITFECDITIHMTETNFNHSSLRTVKQKIFVVLEKTSTGYVVSEGDGITYFNTQKLDPSNLSSVNLTDTQLTYSLTSKEAPSNKKIEYTINRLTGEYSSHRKDGSYFEDGTGTCKIIKRLF